MSACPKLHLTCPCSAALAAWSACAVHDATVPRAGNYRHQADVCHAYHVLTAGGFEPQHVIVMMYDDIAHHPYNPYPGQLFNCPGCPDVYAGVPKDYTGADVTAWNFFSVLLGNWLGVGGAGTGRVVSSRADDRVFVYYTDHGAPGLLAMPQVRGLRFCGCMRCSCTPLDGAAHAHVWQRIGGVTGDRLCRPCPDTAPGAGAAQATCRAVHAANSPALRRGHGAVKL